MGPPACLRVNTALGTERCLACRERSSLSETLPDTARWGFCPERGLRGAGRPCLMGAVFFRGRRWTKLLSSLRKFEPRPSFRSTRGYSKHRYRAAPGEPPLSQRAPSPPACFSVLFRARDVPGACSSCGGGAPFEAACGLRMLHLTNVPSAVAARFSSRCGSRGKCTAAGGRKPGHFLAS